MSLSCSHFNTAEAKVTSVSLAKLVGAYDLNFHLEIQVWPVNKDDNCEIRLDGARVTVSGQGSQRHYLGYARPDIPCHLKRFSHPNTERIAFTRTIQPHELNAMENLRSGGDLKFEIVLYGEGKNGEYVNQVNDTLRYQEPHSDWIKKLKHSGYMDVLLVEIPFPLTDRVELLEAVQNHLEEAQRHYINAEYTSCVASCRKAIEDFGHHIFGKAKWYEDALQPLKGPGSNDGKKISDMDKGERKKALVGVIRHYAHLAHHGEGEGGVWNYTRAEACMILQLSAALINGH